MKSSWRGRNAKIYPESGQGEISSESILEASAPIYKDLGTTTKQPPSVASSSIEKGLSSLNLFPLTGIGPLARSLAKLLRKRIGKENFPSSTFHTVHLGTKFWLLGPPLSLAEWF